MKKYYLFAILMACVFAFSACSNDDDKDEYAPFTPSESSGAYVMNQGNYYSHISSSMGYLDYGKGTLTDSVFVAQNAMTPGNTLQGGLIYGSHLFTIAYESNVMFISDKNTLKVQKVLEVHVPRALVASDGYVFVSNYNGYVTRIDARTMTIKDSVKVGPNPEEMAVANGYLYVTNSDGLNYAKAYANGKSVSKINISTFKVEKTIAVGTNPTKAAADSKGNVYVIAMGDYGAVASELEKIDTNDKVTTLGNASLMCVDGTKLYGVYSVTNWATYVTTNTYFSVNTETGVKTDNLVAQGVDYPLSINVDPVTKHIFITSDNGGQWGEDYSGAGYVNEYKADGSFVKKYATGVHPVQIVFNVK
jgi:hypothetical protein